MKLAFCSRCAIAALMLVFGALSYAQAQTTSPTPDPFAVQVTSSPAGFYSFAGDTTANGRLSSLSQMVIWTHKVHVTPMGIAKSSYSIMPNGASFN